MCIFRLRLSYRSLANYRISGSRRKSSLSEGGEGGVNDNVGDGGVRLT